MHINEIGGVKIAELAERFGTPLYVYEAGVIEQRAEELTPIATVRYAMKACSNAAVLSLLRRKGVLVDCVSAGELRRALKAGFRPEGDVPAVVFTCDVFDRESLELVIQERISVNAGSIDMIHQYGPRATRKGITLRINPGFGHGHSQKTNTGGTSSKHGIWHEQLDEAVQAAHQYGLQVTGIHMHIGSGTDFIHLAKVGEAMKETVRKVGAEVRMISAGGGLPVPYRAGDARIDLQAYSTLWNKVREELAEELGHPLELEIEPGRYLVAEAGSLISEVRAVKHMGENLFYLVDAGFNDLARPVMYGAYHPIRAAAAAQSAETVQAAVAGPLCESGDVFTQQEGGYLELRELPVVQIGDFLVFQVAGAYGASMGSNYNSKPLAAEVLIRDGKAELIRRRQSVETLLADEIIPEDLA